MASILKLCTRDIIHCIRGHLQTEFSTLNVIVMLRGWGVEAMTLRTIVGINCLILLQNLVPSVMLRGGGGGSGLNVTMMLSVLNSVWRCPLIGRNYCA